MVLDFRVYLEPAFRPGDRMQEYREGVNFPQTSGHGTERYAVS